jgi:tRNA A22 N-methylase
MYKTKISKPVDDPLFVVVNYEHNLKEGYETTMNTIILNGTDATEVIEILKKTKDRSIKYWYFLVMEDWRSRINLMHFLQENGFKYMIGKILDDKEGE